MFDQIEQNLIPLLQPSNKGIGYADNKENIKRQAC